MKKLFLLILIIAAPLCKLAAQQPHINIDWDPQRTRPENITPFSANVISPEVFDDHTVIFRLRAPNVSSVLLTGSMFVGQEAGKQVPFTKDEKGLWTLKIGPLTPDIYLYYFIIDGVKVIDPNNTYTGFANMPAFSMLWVHGDGPAFYDAKNVPHGDLVTHYYHSSVSNGEREMLVYTPPSYDKKKKYPVLYLLGGSGDLAQTWAFHGQANFIMDNLLAEGKALPMIIVMPNNQLIHRNDPKHTDLTFGLVEREMKEVIIPYIESHYNVIKNKHGRAISGLSMGGRHAQYVGLNNLDLFGSIGILSAAIPIEQTPALKDKDINSRIDYLFLGAGTYETNPGARHEVLHNDLLKLNVNHEYYVGSKGAHDLITWRHLLYYRFLPNLWRNQSSK
ncbi:MAG TPA: alpha/beta hydrolase-fold protein [Bacteroidales bacterium]|nr:alpha/beta hydrolase-fold protein [Bacteroidales bacterium]